MEKLFRVKGQGSSVKEIAEQVFMAPNASVLGDVRIGENSSVWFGCVLRADINYIQIGKFTNIQDLSVIHVDFDKPAVVGDYVTVGHNANIHGCKIADNVLVGIGAVILSGAQVGPNTIIGAGSVVTEGARLQGGYLYLGVPAKPKRELTQEEKDNIKTHAEKYWEIAKQFK